MNTTSSRERMLAAINHQEPDHVPLYLHFYATFGRPQDAAPPELRWSDQFERAEKLVRHLKIDDVLALDAVRPLNLSTVDVRVRKDHPPSEEHPLLSKTYDTPRGPLRQVVRQTPDWPHGDDIPFVSDYSVPRATEYLIKGPEDLERLKCLLRGPTTEEITIFRDRAAHIGEIADRLGVLVEGHVGSPGTTALHLMGVENLILHTIEHADFAIELFDTLHKWEMSGLEVLLDSGVADVVVVNGFYESLQLWSPAMYRQFFFDPFKQKIRTIHQSGAKCGYNNTGQLIPLVSTFRELGFDVLRYLDPVKGETDLETLKREAGEFLCFLGGVNGAITIGRATVSEVRQATLRAIRTLGPGGGLILSAADAIYEDAPWDNVLAMIDTWRQAGAYPLEV